MDTTAPEKKRYPNLEKAREMRRIKLNLPPPQPEPTPTLLPPPQKNDDRVAIISAELEALREEFQLFYHQLSNMEEDQTEIGEETLDDGVGKEPPKKKKKVENEPTTAEESTSAGDTVGLTQGVHSMLCNTAKAIPSFLSASALPILIIMYKAWRTMGVNAPEHKTDQLGQSSVDMPNDELGLHSHTPPHKEIPALYGTVETPRRNAFPER